MLIPLAKNRQFLLNSGWIIPCFTVLKLNHNRISDISILEKVNFKELKELNLSNNQILDISVLEKVNFKELKELYLSGNRISDISILEKVNFKATL